MPLLLPSPGGKVDFAKQKTDEEWRDLKHSEKSDRVL